MALDAMVKSCGFYQKYMNKGTRRGGWGCPNFVRRADLAGILTIAVSTNCKQPRSQMTFFPLDNKRLIGYYEGDDET
jgi:hypothetical protein